MSRLISFLISLLQSQSRSHLSHTPCVLEFFRRYFVNKIIIVNSSRDQFSEVLTRRDLFFDSTPSSLIFPGQFICTNLGQQIFLKHLPHIF